jgi:tripartite-type tricarboxylate transporter receptor subunit TctC
MLTRNPKYQEQALERINRRSANALISASLACALSLPSGAAQAQAYPQKPVHMVVPAATAGATDLFARKFAQRFEKHLGTTVVLSNKGGGSGTIGTGDVARATPDGYTLLMSTTGNVVINPLTIPMNFDPSKELVPIAVLGFVAFSINTWPGLGASNVREFINVVKASPGKYSFATNGPAGFIHLITELFNKQAGLQMTSVPYPGGSAMQQDLIAGRVQVYFDAFNSALRFHRSGQTRLLATTSGQRSPAAPDIPTVAETMPGYEAEFALILMAPVGTPAPILDRLLAATQKTMAEEGFAKELEGLGVRAVIGSNPRATADYIRAEFEKWAPVAKSVK